MADDLADALADLRQLVFPLVLMIAFFLAITAVLLLFGQLFAFVPSIEVYAISLLAAGSAALWLAAVAIELVMWLLECSCRLFAWMMTRDPRWD